jgi:hypothetical protein
MAGADAGAYKLPPAVVEEVGAFRALEAVLTDSRESAPSMERKRQELSYPQVLATPSASGLP